MRSDPFYDPLAPGWLGFAYFMLKRYSEAVSFLMQCVTRAPKFRTGHVFLAATYAQMGQLEDARKEATEILRIQPSYTISGTQRAINDFKRPQDAEHFFGSLRKAGLPE